MTRKNISEAMGNVSNRHIEELMTFRETGTRVTMQKTNNYEKRKKEMKTNKTAVFLKRPATIAAALAVIICLSAVAGFAAAGKLHGFFKDIFSFNGAVISTEYMQATDEVEIKAATADDILEAEIIMLYPEISPYNVFEAVSIKSYNITDVNGKVVCEGADIEAAGVKDGRVIVKIPTDKLPDGNYKLTVSELVGEKKADQSLILHGMWQCAFAK